LPNGGQRRPGIKAHPHVLRRACGYALANKDTTPGLFRVGWGTGRLPELPSTRRWRQTGSRTSGAMPPAVTDLDETRPLIERLFDQRSEFVSWDAGQPGRNAEPWAGKSTLWIGAGEMRRLGNAPARKCLHLR
jgi:hypothetical protein